MRHFNFEYTDLKLTLKLLALSFLAFAVLLIGMILTLELIGVVAGLILAIGVPLVIFLLNKKKIKKRGTATIDESSALFILANATRRVAYADIRTYQVERYNGTHLRIRYRDGARFTLHADSNFCNADHFDDFCREFENVVQQYKRSHKTELTRTPSMFERAWMLPLLIVLTAGLIGGAIFAISLRKHIPPTFYSSAAIILAMWVGYATARKRRQPQ